MVATGTTRPHTLGRVLFVSCEFSTPRHRCENPREGLAKFGVGSEVVDTRDSAFLDSLANATHIVSNRVPLTPKVAQAMARAVQQGSKLLFDMDDLLFLPELLAGLPFVECRSPEERERLLLASAQMRTGMDHCDAGICATPNLAREVGGAIPVFVVNNAVSDELVDLSRTAATERKENGHFTIGYLCGHPGHVFNFAVVSSSLAVLLASHSRLRVRIVGSMTELPQGLEAFADRIDFVPYLDWRALPREIARMDACVAPLIANRFNECKSDLKFLETALCSVPLVASRVSQFTETIRDGANGFLAASKDEWVAKVETLIGNPDRRVAMGKAAQEYVLAHRRTEHMGASLVRALGTLKGTA